MTAESRIDGGWNTLDDDGKYYYKGEPTEFKFERLKIVSLNYAIGVTGSEEKGNLRYTPIIGGEAFGKFANEPSSASVSKGRFVHQGDLQEDLLTLNFKNGQTAFFVIHDDNKLEKLTQINGEYKFNYPIKWDYSQMFVQNLAGNMDVVFSDMNKTLRQYAKEQGIDITAVRNTTLDDEILFCDDYNRNYIIKINDPKHEIKAINEYGGIIVTPAITREGTNITKEEEFSSEDILSKNNKLRKISREELWEELMEAAGELGKLLHKKAENTTKI